MAPLDLRGAAVETGRLLIAAAAGMAWRGPDPYDGLLQPWPRVIRGGPRRRQIIVQLHARAPVDIRRLYRRRAQPRLAKALAVFGQAALRLDSVCPDEATRRRGLDALELLVEDRSGGVAWGYPFDVQTRWSFYPAGTPNVVVTAFAGSALAEAGRELSDASLSARADGAARWMLDSAFDERSGAFRYHEQSNAVIHNANLLAARLVWSRLPNDGVARTAVRRAVDRSLAAQAGDGTWAYGEGPGLEWTDSFHTGFVLGSLADLREADTAVDGALRRGAAAYVDRFFGPRGEARLWPGQDYPEDAHAAGTGLSTLASLVALGLVDPALLARVTARVVGSTVVGGHATWRRGRWGATSIPYIRWCDAHVALGLADAAVAGSEAH